MKLTRPCPYDSCQGSETKNWSMSDPLRTRLGIGIRSLVPHSIAQRKSQATSDSRGRETNSTSVKVKSLSRVWLFATPWTVALQAPSSMEFSRQEYWSGLPFPSPISVGQATKSHYQVLHQGVDAELCHSAIYHWVSLSCKSKTVENTSVARSPGLTFFSFMGLWVTQIHQR